MSIEIDCQGCGQRIRVAEEHAGKKARCPSCQAINPIPALSASLGADPISGSQTPATFPSTSFSSATTPALTPASPFPPVGALSPSTFFAPGSNPFADRPQGNPFASNPYGTPTYAGPPRTWVQPHRGALVLTLSLVAIFISCPFAILAPIAVWMGHADLAAMKKGQMDPDGHGLTLAGVIIGWIITAGMLLSIAFFGLLFVIAIVSGK
jgi:hypothetical protein